MQEHCDGEQMFSYIIDQDIHQKFFKIKTVGQNINKFNFLDSFIAHTDWNKQELICAKSFPLRNNSIMKVVCIENKCCVEVLI